MKKLIILACSIFIIINAVSSFAVDDTYSLKNKSTTALEQIGE